MPVAQESRRYHDFVGQVHRQKALEPVEPVFAGEIAREHNVHHTVRVNVQQFCAVRNGEVASSVESVLHTRGPR
jgi:hypothetical protein